MTGQNCLFLFWCHLLLVLESEGAPLFLTTSKVNVAQYQPGMERDYVEMFFMPAKKTLVPPSLRYNVHIPLKRLDLPPDLLSVSNKVDFDQLDISTRNMTEAIFSQEQAILGEIKDDNLLVPNEDIIRISMEEVFNLPRNVQADSMARDNVGSYIYEKLGRSGLVITIHDFNHEIPLKAFAKLKGSIVENSPIISGSNIIGILPGKYWRTRRDRPFVLGAHWDTVANSTGFNDNGSGVAVMLEAARVLTGAPCFNPDFTLFFVAFDSEEDGSFGSQEFLSDLLVPTYVRQGVKIQGAIILDTLFNYDTNPGSQIIPESWPLLVPETAKRIEESGNRGDFLAVVSRNHPDERQMSDLLRKWSTLDNLKTEEFFLSKLPPYHEPSLEVLQEHAYFWQSDNSRFWFYKEGRDFSSFPAVLLTDTAFHRGYMQQCYHSECDRFNPEVATDEKFKFLTSIAQSVILTVAEMAMESRAEGSCIPQTVQHLVQAATDLHSWSTTQRSRPRPVPRKTTTPTPIERPKRTTGQPVESSTEEFDLIGPTTTSRPTMHTQGPTSSIDVLTSNEVDFNLKRPTELKKPIERPTDDQPASLKDGPTLPKTELSTSFATVDFAVLLMEELVKKMPRSIGTQINIDTLNINIHPNGEDDRQCPASHHDGESSIFSEEENSGIIIGSEGQFDSQVLANVVKNFLAEKDRRKYKGKQKNSPMVIKFVPTTSE